jgi:hypothetical protein
MKKLSAIKEEIVFKYNLHKVQLLEAEAAYGGVFIARIEEDDGVNLEVEVNEGTIAFSIRLDASDLKDRNLEDKTYTELKDFLETNRVSVYQNYREWEEALDSED